MSRTDRLKRTPKAFRQLTGITPVAFDQLPAELTPRRERAELRRKTRRPRQRKPGAGPEHELLLADRLLVLPINDRTDTAHAFLGFLSGTDDSAARRNVDPFQPLSPAIFRTPERTVELEPDETRDLFFDATERPIPRPSRRQTRFDSGEKKRHAVKRQIVLVRKRKTPGRNVRRRRVRIVAVSPAFPGAVRDEKASDRTRAVVPPGVKRTGDAADLGTPSETPTRRPRKGQFADRQKARNRRASKGRIVADHGIGKMKVWRIAAERYRNPGRSHTVVMKNIAGLHDRMYA
jgi:hypothetical protein